MRNKKVLITGATGFIGANLARRYIKYGADVHIFVRSTSDNWRIKEVLKDVNKHSLDLLDHEGVRRAVSKIKPEIILHAAAHGGHFFQTDELKIMRDNIMGTVNLVDACARNGFECFINSGSSSEYGIKSEAMREEDILAPVNAYGVSKAAASMFCSMKADIMNLPLATLRIFSPYGYYDEKSRLISSVILSCLSGKNPRLSSAHYVRDFIFIDDVVDAYVAAVKKINKIKGKVLNVGSGKQCSVGEVVKKVMKFTGNNVKAEWGTVKNTGKEPICWRADISKAKRSLNWQPDYSIDRGLRKTIDWFKKNISLYK